MKKIKIGTVTEKINESILIDIMKKTGSTLGVLAFPYKM